MSTERLADGRLRWTCDAPGCTHEIEFERGASEAAQGWQFDVTPPADRWDESRSASRTFCPDHARQASRR